MNAGHTSGPWVFSLNGPSFTVSGDPFNPEKKTPYQGGGWGVRVPNERGGVETICGGTWDDYSRETVEANARLIAAAPELLSELEALVTAVCFADPPKLFNGVEGHEARVPLAFVEGARAAIAKAKGAA